MTAMAGVLATEGPILLGYLVVAAAIGLGALVGIWHDSDARAVRRRNRAVRHARAGCDVCRLRLTLTANRQESDR